MSDLHEYKTSDLPGLSDFALDRVEGFEWVSDSARELTLSPGDDADWMLGE